MIFPEAQTPSVLHQDFVDAGEALFALAFTRHNQESLDPMFIGKPLGLIELHVARETFTSAEVLRVINPIFREELTVTPGVRRPNFVDFTLPQTIGPDFKASDIPADSAMTVYQGERCLNDEVMGFNSLGMPSDLRLIIAGLWLAETGLSYVASDMFTAGYQERSEADYVGFNDWHEMGLKHRWTFALSPNLPLNGSEPSGFLSGYRAVMNRKACTLASEIKKLREQGNDPWFIARRESEYESYKRAIGRATSVINAR